LVSTILSAIECEPSVFCLCYLGI